MTIRDSFDDTDEFWAESDRRARERRERRRTGVRRLGPRRRAAHGHRRRDLAHLIASRAGRWLIATVVLVACATVAGLVLMWPGGLPHDARSAGLGGPTRSVTVSRSDVARCAGPAAQACRRITVRVDGRTSQVTLGPVRTAPRVAAGDTVRVSRVRLPAGGSEASAEPYAFVDYDRSGALRLQAVVLLALMLVLLWWRGILAALGVGLSLLLITQFTVPAILAGRPALLVALISSLAVMFITVVLTNGIGAQMLAGAVGIAATLLLTCILGTVFVGLAHLDGFTSDIALVLRQHAQQISLQGVVLAGMVIGALGVLADTAVTQASAVMALRRANPSLAARELYGGALSVGRDHLAATIHTLVLAYAGASLPLLLVLRTSGLGATDAINSQDIAEPIIATLVGCIGLVAALPLTTATAALLASRIPPPAIAEGHDHAH